MSTPGPLPAQLIIAKKSALTFIVVEKAEPKKQKIKEFYAHPKKNLTGERNNFRN